MKKTTALLTGLFLLGAGAAGVSAVANGVLDTGEFGIRGSDTLENIMIDLINDDACGAVSPALEYVGGGSSNGEEAAKQRQQEIAPMSRTLDASPTGRPCTMEGPAAKGEQAEGLVIGLDGVGVLADEGTTTACGAADGFAEIRRTGSVTVTGNENGTAGVQWCQTAPCSATYNFDSGTPADTSDDWKDILRVLFFGWHHDLGGTDNAGLPVLTNAGRQLNSDVRNYLVQNYTAVFEGGCDDCATLTHLFRRADDSGTTDVFRTLLNVPGSSTVTSSSYIQYANGRDLSDGDPIRRNCDNITNPNPLNAVDQVCTRGAGGAGSLGNKGLLLPIQPPEGFADPYTLNGGATPVTCSSSFAFKPAAFLTQTVCPCGNPSKFGQCLVPRSSAATGSLFGCLNGRFNTPAGITLGTCDARVFNTEFRDKTTGNIILGPDNREYTASFYRLRNACLLSSATDQIGCLVDNVTCSLGYSGREACPAAGGTDCAELDNIEPTITNIQNLATNAGAPYPFARRLYINSLVGFENAANPEAVYGADTTTALTDGADSPAFGVRSPANCHNDQNAGTACDEWADQQVVAACASRESVMNAIMTDLNFVRLPETGTAECDPVLFPNGCCVFCENFDEQTACGAASANDGNSAACANNPVVNYTEQVGGANVNVQIPTFTSLSCAAASHVD